ncbi:hypothetical protein GH714_013990 [Hevea brasiliensis]|uniref:Rx N-terminal domain-containing protein n=1 Tax=Hevea brasiliensis TaxID=3981 RepID=A0A6A6MZ71_HEVBR|nr:hypothetical protein GH714_013990 [Hevea brasiliensis]
MAEMILSFVVEAALSRVSSLIANEIISAWKLNDEFKGLQDSLTMIRDVLQDAEEQQTEKESVKRWLKKLKEVAYDAEDVFDELAYENLRRKVEMQINREWRILGEMLQTLNANMGGMTNKDAILQQLEKALESKKFLLVLDDVWNNEPDRKGHLEVEEINPHRLGGHWKGDCQKMWGVPLAAKVLGGTMGFKMDKEEWLSIRNSNVLSKGNVESILKLSFDHLPSHEVMFRILFSFPERYSDEKEQLIRLWMAEGLVGISNADEATSTLMP